MVLPGSVQPASSGALRIRLPPRPPTTGDGEARMQDTPDANTTTRTASTAIAESSASVTAPGMDLNLCICGEVDSAAMVKCDGPACNQKVCQLVLQMNLAILTIRWTTCHAIN